MKDWFLAHVHHIFVICCEVYEFCLRGEVLDSIKQGKQQVLDDNIAGNTIHQQIIELTPYFF